MPLCGCAGEGWGWQRTGESEGYEAHAGPGAEIENPPHQGLEDRGQRFPFITAKLGNAKDSVGQARQPAVRCYHGEHPKGPRKIDDKYNNTRCNHEGQLPAMRLPPALKAPSSSNGKKSRRTFEGKLPSNVVIFPLRL